MAEPKFGVTTERLYRRLPDVYREQDENQGWPFKKFLASITKVLNDVDLLTARFRYMSQVERTMFKRFAQRDTVYDHPNRVKGAPELGSTSDLVDPLAADESWLPWLGQLVGIKITANMNIFEKRDAIAYAAAGYRAGSKDALEKAVRLVLSGSRYAVALPHTKVENGNIMAGTTWDVTMLTRNIESPSSEVILAQIDKPTVKPAGVKLYHRVYQASWDALEAALPYWKDWNAVTWEVLEQIGVSYRALVGNLVPNPSFETDASSWSTTGAATQARQAGGVDGAGQLRVDFSGTGNKLTKSGVFSVVANKAYTAGLTYKSTVAARLVVLQGSTEVASLDLPASTTAWRRANTGFMPAAAGSDYSIAIATSNGTVNDNYTLDGAVVRDATI